MGESTDGLHSLLSFPAIYRLFQDLTGAKAGRKRVIDEYIRPYPEARILDLGCGPADYFAEMIDADYTGIDHSAAYIDAALMRFRGRGRFIVGDVTQFALEEPGSFDIVIAAGLIHHLDNEQAREVHRSAARLLKPQGRMVTIDPAYVSGQSVIARYLIDRDRGLHVRTIEAYAGLAGAIFPSVSAHMRQDLLRIPYTHCILECRPSLQEGERRTSNT